MSYTAEDWRPHLQELEKGYGGTANGAPPYQLLEGMVNLETGGSFDPATYEPSSGAIGLGQITTTGQEWADWVAANPDATADKLNDPEYNLDVMAYGMFARHARGAEEYAAGRPGALVDWYMTAASYLGGADESGFNGQADSLGTDGKEYVESVFRYIGETFSLGDAQAIDELEPGTAFGDGYRSTPSFRADQQAGDSPSGIPAQTSTVQKELDAIRKTLGHAVTGAASFVYEKAAKQVIDWLQSASSGLLALAGPFALRAGLFVLGLIVLIVGARIVFT